MMSRSSAPGPRVSRPQSTPALKVCRSPVLAGASARIETYFGFPTGISGQALTARAFIQAQKFGADIMIPVAVTTLDCSRPNGVFVLEAEGGDRIQARTIVV